MSVPMPLDDDFLRRECPACQRQFKWHHGPTDDRPKGFVDSAVYHCPYCGETAETDDWWTVEQLAFARDSLAGVAIREIAGQLKGALTRGGQIEIKVEYDEPSPPEALHEPNDMMLVEPPCHPWEPLKIEDGWAEAIHCLLCGSTFAVG